MSNLPTPKIHDVKSKLHAAVNAHAAVIAGIATHAEREQAKRQARFLELETKHKLDGTAKP